MLPRRGKGKLFKFELEKHYYHLFNTSVFLFGLNIYEDGIESRVDRFFDDSLMKENLLTVYQFRVGSFLVALFCFVPLRSFVTSKVVYEKNSPLLETQGVLFSKSAFMNGWPIFIGDSRPGVALKVQIQRNNVVEPIGR